MKKSDIITREEALAKARAEKDIPNTVGHVFYHLLSEAKPEVVEMYEKMLVNAMQFGDVIRRELSEAKPGTPEYNEYHRMILDMTNKNKHSIDADFEKLKKGFNPEQFDPSKKADDDGE